MVHSGYCSSDHALCVYVVDCRIWCTANVLCVLLHRKRGANPYTETCCMMTLLTCSYIFYVIYDTIQWVPSSIPKLVKTEGEALWDSAATFCLDTIVEISDSNHFSCQPFGLKFMLKQQVPQYKKQITNDKYEWVLPITIQLPYLHFDHLLQNSNRITYYAPLCRLHKIQSSWIHCLSWNLMKTGYPGNPLIIHWITCNTVKTSQAGKIANTNPMFK